MDCGLSSVVFISHVPEGSDFPGRYLLRKESDRCFKADERICFNLGSSTSVKTEASRIVFETTGIDCSELLIGLYKSKVENQS